MSLFRPLSVAWTPDLSPPLPLVRAAPALQRLYGMAGNPVPDGAACKVVRASDGTGLRWAHWPAQARRSCGTVVLLPGRADHVEKYFEVVGELIHRGYGVVAMDWRGQGGSERLLVDGRKGHIDHADGYARDLQAVLALLPHLQAPRPWIALGHSMGGAVLLQALSQGTTPLDAAVVTAPMLALAPGLAPPLAHPACRALSAVGLSACSLPDPNAHSQPGRPFDPDNLLTTDPVRYARIAAVNTRFPWLAVGRPTIGWVASAFSIMASLRRPSATRSIDRPLLVAAGSEDAVTSSPVAKAFAGRVDGADCVIVPGCRHEVLLERDETRAVFWQAFDGFVAQRIPRAA